MTTLYDDPLMTWLAQQGVMAQRRQSQQMPVPQPPDPLQELLNMGQPAPAQPQPQMPGPMPMPAQPQGPDPLQELLSMQPPAPAPEAVAPTPVQAPAPVSVTPATPETPGLWGEVKEQWKAGQRAADLMPRMVDSMFGMGEFKTPEEWYQAYKASQTYDEQTLGKQKDRGYLGESLKGAANTLPPMVMGQTEGAGFAVAGGALGGMPTAGLGAIPGAAMGYGLGNAQYWYRFATGDLYASMRDEGVSSEVAEVLAPLAAMPYTAVEMAQQKLLLSGFKRTAASGLVRKKLIGAAKKFAGQYGDDLARAAQAMKASAGQAVEAVPGPVKAVMGYIGRQLGLLAGEVAEEGTQGGIEGYLDETGKAIDTALREGAPNLRELYQGQKQAVTVAAKEAWEQAVQSIGPLALIQAPGGMWEGGRGYLDYRREKKTEQAVQQLIDQLGLGPQQQMPLEGGAAPATMPTAAPEPVLESGVPDKPAPGGVTPQPPPVLFDPTVPESAVAWAQANPEAAAQLAANPTRAAFEALGISRTSKEQRQAVAEAIREPVALQAASARTDEILDSLRGDEQVAQLLASPSGVREGYTVEEHTRTVMGNLPAQVDARQLGRISKKAGARIGEMLPILAALHDIGKPIAVRQGMKGRQHEATIPILQRVMKDQGFTDREVEIATALVDNDILGDLLRGRIDARQAWDQLTEQSKRARMHMGDFFTLLTAFYKADAGSYPAVRSEVFLEDPTGTLRIPNVEFGILEEAIHGEVRDLSWLERLDAQRAEAGGNGRDRGSAFVHGAAVEFGEFDEAKDSGRNLVGPGVYLLDSSDADVASHYARRAVYRMLAMFRKDSRRRLLTQSPERREANIQYLRDGAAKLEASGDKEKAAQWREAVRVLEAIRDGRVGPHVLPVDYTPKAPLVLGAVDTGGSNLSEQDRNRILAAVPDSARTRVLSATKGITRGYQFHLALTQAMGSSKAANDVIRAAGYDSIVFVHPKGGYTRPYQVVVALSFEEPQIQTPGAQQQQQAATPVPAQEPVPAAPVQSVAAPAPQTAEGQYVPTTEPETPPEPWVQQEPEPEVVPAGPGTALPPPPEPVPTLSEEQAAAPAVEETRRPSEVVTAVADEALRVAEQEYAQEGDPGGAQFDPGVRDLRALADVLDMLEAKDKWLSELPAVRDGLYRVARIRLSKYPNEPWAPGIAAWLDSHEPTGTSTEQAPAPVPTPAPAPAPEPVPEAAPAPQPPAKSKGLKKQTPEEAAVLSVAVPFEEAREQAGKPLTPARKRKVRSLLRKLAARPWGDPEELATGLYSAQEVEEGAQEEDLADMAGSLATAYDSHGGPHYAMPGTDHPDTLIPESVIEEVSGALLQRNTSDPKFNPTKAIQRANQRAKAEGRAVTAQDFLSEMDADYQEYKRRSQGLKTEPKPEPKPQPAVKRTTEKEPWEMTKAEWEKSPRVQGFRDEIKEIRKRHTALRKATPNVRVDRRYGLAAKVRMDDEIRGAESNLKNAIADHRSSIVQALAEGKPVPAEVLAEYPDLAGKQKETPGDQEVRQGVQGGQPQGQEPGRPVQEQGQGAEAAEPGGVLQTPVAVVEKPKKAKGVKKEASKPATPERQEYQRQTPRKGTPEREEYDAEYQRLKKEADEAYAVRKAAQEAMNKAKRGTKKHAEAESRFYDTLDRYAAAAKAIEEFRLGYVATLAEDMVETETDPVHRQMLISKANGAKGFNEAISAFEDRAKEILKGRGLSDEEMGRIAFDAAHRGWQNVLSDWTVEEYVNAQAEGVENAKREKARQEESERRVAEEEKRKRDEDLASRTREELTPFSDVRVTGANGWAGNLNTNEGVLSDGASAVDASAVSGKTRGLMRRKKHKTQEAKAMDDATWLQRIADTAQGAVRATLAGVYTKHVLNPTRAFTHKSEMYTESHRWLAVGGEDGRVEVFDPDKVAFLTQATGADSYRLGKGKNAILVFMKGDKPVAILMPMRQKEGEELTADTLRRLGYEPPKPKSKGLKGETTSDALLSEAEADDAGMKEMRGGLGLALGGKKARPRTDTVPEAARSSDPEVERRLEAAHGMPEVSRWSKLRDAMVDAWHKATRTQQFLSHDTKWDVAREVFRLLKDAGVNAKDSANRAVAAIINPMGPQQKRVFERYLVLHNLDKAVRNGQPFRFGYNAETLAKDLKAIDELVKQIPEVQEALKRRKKELKRLVDQLKKHDLLPQDTDPEDYYHQQVFMLLQVDAVTRGRGLHQQKRSWQHKRVTGVDEFEERYDYNTDYIEAEATWMTEAYIELAKAKAREQINEHYGLDVPDLRAKARERNWIAFVGGRANAGRIEELRGLIAESRSGEDASDSGERMKRKAWHEELDKLDPTVGVRQRMAMAVSGVQKAIQQEEADLKGLPSRLDPHFEWDRDGREAMEFDDEEEGGGNLIEFMKWLADNKADTDMGKWALTFFKAIQERRTMIREKLGKDFATWETLVKEKGGYGEFYPGEQNVWFQAHSIPERIAAALEKNLAEQIGISKDDINKVWARGGKRTPMVLPVELIQQMNTMDKPKQLGHVAEFAEAAVAAMKSWYLFAPHKVVGYGLRNLLGDLDPVIAACPKALAHVAKATRELIQLYRGEYTLSPEMRAALDGGVLKSSMTAKEIPHLRDVEFFKRFYTDKAWDPKEGLHPMKWTRAANEFREAALRYAVFLYYLDQLKQGKMIHYGGAKRSTVETLRNTLGNEVAAAHLARNLLGDYSNMTIMGNWLRHFLIPFWSWNEINLKRYPRLVINALTYGDSKTIARTGGVVGLAALRAVLLSRVALFYAAMWCFNNLMHPDDEDELSEYDRANPHIILPVSPADGSTVIVRGSNALGDFLEWFGINTLLSYFPQYQEGQMDGLELAKLMLRDPMNKALQGLAPQYKGTYELITGLSTFPDVTRPRQAPRSEIFWNTIALGDIAREAEGRLFQTGERARPGTWASMLGVAVSDPRLTALNDIISLRERFLKKEKQPILPPGDAQMRAMKYAVINNDYTAFREAMRLYLKKGKTLRDFRKASKYWDPIAMRLNDKDEWRFEHEYLNDAQRKKLHEARTFMNDTMSKAAHWAVQVMEEGNDRDKR